MLKGRAAAAETAARTARWHTYHQMLPHVGGMPSLEDFLGKRASEPVRRKTPEEIEAMGLRWHYALNARA